MRDLIGVKYKDNYYCVWSHELKKATFNTGLISTYVLNTADLVVNITQSRVVKDRSGVYGLDSTFPKDDESLFYSQPILHMHQMESIMNIVRMQDENDAPILSVNKFRTQGENLQAQGRGHRRRNMTVVVSQSSDAGWSIISQKQIDKLLNEQADSPKTCKGIKFNKD